MRPRLPVWRTPRTGRVRGSAPRRGLPARTEKSPRRPPLATPFEHEALLELVLLPRLARRVDQAMRVERVAALRLVEVVLEALRRCERLQSRVRGRDLVGAPAVLGRQMLGGGAAPRGRVPVELERPPQHPDLAAMREPRQRRLEAALADVAPRTDDVRPDLDEHALV